MMTGPFTLPTVWRPGAVVCAEVPFADLAEPLRVLARPAELSTVLVAAHMKVLSMLTEEPAFHTAIRPEPQGGTCRLDVCSRGARTWRGLVALVPMAAEPDAGPGQVIFNAGADAMGDCDLAVSVGDGVLVLHATDGDWVARLAAMYRRVLESMAFDPDGDCRTACLPADERAAVLTRWSSGPSVHRAHDTVVDLFSRQTARTPDAAAVVVAGTPITYREVEERSNQIARHLARLGGRRDTPVGICLRRTADLLPAIFGVWKSGAAYLPLDPDLPGRRLAGMAATAGCDLVISDHPATVESLVGVRSVHMDEVRGEIAALPCGPVATRIRPVDSAYVIYTSGSTGTPKGVLVHHGGLANYLLWTVDEYAARGTGGSAFFTSIGFDLGVPSLFTPLLAGQPVVLLPDPLDFAELGEALLAGSAYSFLKMTPGQLNMLSLDLTAEQARGLAGLVIAAGDAFPAELARRWTTLAGTDGTALATEYGPTEITVGNSGQAVTDHDSDGLVPLGTPIPNTTMYVLDELLEPVPIGVPGEIYVGGAGVSHGYLGDPVLTAKRFVPDPYGQPGARLYRTGDRARWQPEGTCEFLGRTDLQVKIRGYRVEPSEIQQALRRHPDVSEAVVIGYEQPPRPMRLAAFVVPVDGRQPDMAGLRAHLAEALPGHMVPAEIVAIGDIPLTANGKVDQRALRDLLPAAPRGLRR